MGNPIDDIRNRISGRGNSREFTEDDLITIYEDICIYIHDMSWNEFEKIPSTRLFILNERAQEEKRKKEQFMMSVMSGLGAKKEQINKWVKG